VPAPHAASEDVPLTPPPAAAHGAVPAATNGHAKSNGLAARASSPALALGGDSDALSSLNLAASGAAAKAKAPPPPPRIREVGEATAWSGAGRVQEGRHKNTKMALGLAGVVAVIIIVVAINLNKKAPAPVAAAQPIKAGLDSEALAKLADIKVDEVKVSTTAKPPEPPPEPPRGKNGRGRGPVRGRPQGRGGVAGPGTGAGTGAATTVAGPGEQPPAPSGGGLRERGVTQYNAVANRPPPSQADITRVIANNKLGIKTCYQRALLRDSNLTHGKIVVGVTIGISGRVKGVRVDGPASFRTLEPCIKEMVYRWTFPQAGDEYGTEFSYVFQGNE
ncbi:MAG TPA: AgmX/PglI C-terminal domain-containing protein, partial [Polyangia bacterium]|nr:AgmX/PglI C-terminal domain-containing protein [Polyangia bacterium]